MFDFQIALYSIIFIVIMYYVSDQVHYKNINLLVTVITYIIHNHNKNNRIQLLLLLLLFYFFFNSCKMHAHLINSIYFAIPSLFYMP